MQSLIMAKSAPQAWMLMPILRSRIERFDREFCLDGNATRIAANFEQHFAAGDARMFATLLIHDERVVGHVVAGVDTYHGVPTAVIYQYEKDITDEDSQNTNDQVQSALDTWALGLGLSEISALATSPGRAKHFEHWGYRYSATLVTRRIGHGRQE